MNWIAPADAVLPDDGRAGFVIHGRCGLSLMALDRIPALCPSCGRDSWTCYKRVVIRYKGYPDVTLEPDPDLIASIRAERKSLARESWGRRTGRKIAAWVRSMVKLIQHPRHPRHAS